MHVAVLPPILRGAVGQVVEVAFAGYAEPGDPFNGQALYCEWRRDDVFDQFLIPEQDLEFVPPARVRSDGAACSEAMKPAVVATFVARGV
jgi:hypothetical protein